MALSEPGESNGSCLVGRENRRFHSSILQRVSKAECGQRFAEKCRLREVAAMFARCLNLTLFLIEPTVRTLRLLSCPRRLLLSSAQLPSRRLPKACSGLRRDALPVI